MGHDVSLYVSVPVFAITMLMVRYNGGLCAPCSADLMHSQCSVPGFQYADGEDVGAPCAADLHVHS